jgi:hypothetical protein
MMVYIISAFGSEILARLPPLPFRQPPLDGPSLAGLAAIRREQIHAAALFEQERHDSKMMFKFFK